MRFDWKLKNSAVDVFNPCSAHGVTGDVTWVEVVAPGDVEEASVYDLKYTAVYASVDWLTCS